MNNLHRQLLRDQVLFGISGYYVKKYNLFQRIIRRITGKGFNKVEIKRVSPRKLLNLI